MAKEYQKPVGVSPAGKGGESSEPGDEGKNAIKWQIRNGGISSQEQNPEIDD